MHILFATYPWAFDCPGGGERQLLAWNSHLVSRGVNVHLYDPWKRLPAKCQIFHFFSVMPGSFQLCEYIANKGVKLVITPNLWVTPTTKFSYPHEEIKKLVSLADLIVVNSKAEATSLSEVYELPLGKMAIVYNGVETDFFENVSCRLFAEQYGVVEKRYFLNVANVEPRKNQLAFLRALKAYPGYQCVTVGHVRDPDYFSACKSLGGKQFCYVGPLKYKSEMLRSALAGAAGFVMPSTLETPSIAALEAAAAGCPVLITQVGSTIEYFGPGAVYVDPTDDYSMDSGIRELLCSGGGAQRINELRERIRINFTCTISAQKLLETYQKLRGL